MSDLRSDVSKLHENHPKIRAEDWRSGLVRRLLNGSSYEDGARQMTDSYRTHASPETDGVVDLHWSGLADDFARYTKTYQDPVITEHAALALACILVHGRLGMEITEVTRRGEKVDYWLGDRELLLEVSGEIGSDVESLCERKAEKQLLQNPLGKSGYVCAVAFGSQSARLWYYPVENGK